MCKTEQIQVSLESARLEAGVSVEELAKPGVDRVDAVKGVCTSRHLPDGLGVVRKACQLKFLDQQVVRRGHIVDQS